MSKTQFTVIIRSIDKDNDNDHSSDCWIKLHCPSQYKNVQCEVVHFYVPIYVADVIATNIFDLRCDNLSLINHYDIKHSIALCNATDVLVSVAYSMPFMTENFNNKRIHFQLYNEVNDIIANNGAPYANNWTLILKCTGIEE